MPQIKLVSNDNVYFKVDAEIVTKCMKTIENLLDGLGEFDPEEEIPIPVADAETLKVIIDWAIYHKDRLPFYEEVRDISEWDENFLEVNREALSDIIEAAKYLEMGSLLQLCYVHMWR